MRSSSCIESETADRSRSWRRVADSGSCVMRLMARGNSEACHEAAYALLDLVTNVSDNLYWLLVWVRELPVLVPLARIDGTRVATAHGHDHVCSSDGFFAPCLRRRLSDVDAYLVHGLGGHSVYLVRRTGAPRNHVNPIAAEMA